MTVSLSRFKRGKDTPAWPLISAPSHSTPHSLQTHSQALVHTTSIRWLAQPHPPAPAPHLGSALIP